MPDMRGFGGSDKPRERSAYENSAHSSDVAALIDYLHMDAVDVIGYSMGCGTTARLLALNPQRVKSAILAGVGDYAAPRSRRDRHPAASSGAPRTPCLARRPSPR
jgi:pimeloyl-ACP methyl ester carboxylesterase